MEQPVSDKTIGQVVPLLNTLTNAEIKDPKPSCRAPRRADALPASREKGAIERAEALGTVKPCPAMNRKTVMIRPYRPNQPFVTPRIRKVPINNCQSKAASTSCSLVNHFNISLFNWLDPIIDAAMQAKIQP